MTGKAGMFELVRYTAQQRELWDQAVQKSKNGSFLHLRNYLDYHAHRFNEQSVVVLRQGKPVAVFPSNRVGDLIVSHGGLTYGGLLYGKDLRAVEVLQVFELLSLHYKRQGIKEVLYKAIPHVFHNYPAEEDLYALFRLDAQLCRRDISAVIQLEGRVTFSDSRKGTIRKAAKFGIEIREGEFFQQYHDLLAQVVAKFGSEPVHSPQELQLLKSRFPDQIRLFGAFESEQLVAGTIVYDFGPTVHTQYMASSDRGRETGALDSVLVHLIEEKYCSRRYFSFGISTEQDGRRLNEKLLFQKEGFGARGLVHDFYRWSLV